MVGCDHNDYSIEKIQIHTIVRCIIYNVESIYLNIIYFNYFIVYLFLFFLHFYMGFSINFSTDPLSLPCSPLGVPKPQFQNPWPKVLHFPHKPHLNWNIKWGYSTPLCCFRHLLRTFCLRQMSSRLQEMLCVSSESCSASHLGAGTYTFTPGYLPDNLLVFPLK